MPGLVVGLLTRHAEQVAGEADPFLASPDVWGLESARAAMEAGVHAQGRDDPGVPGSDRRSWTMVNLAGCLVFNAVNRSDQDRVDALRAAGSALVAAAAGSAGQDRGRDDEPSAESARNGRRLMREKTASFWPSSGAGQACWTLTTTRSGTKNGNVVWEWQPPADIEAAMAASRSDLERRSQVYRLISTYSLRADPPYLAAPPPLPPAQTLTADAQTARSLAEQPPGLGPEPLDAATAVAAALLRAAVQAARLDNNGRSRVGSRHRRGSAVSSPGCIGSVRGHHVSPRRGPVRGERGSVPAHARAHRTR